jgi:hypothetical protein
MDGSTTNEMASARDGKRFASSFLSPPREAVELMMTVAEAIE